MARNDTDELVRDMARVVAQLAEDNWGPLGGRALGPMDPGFRRERQEAIEAGRRIKRRLAEAPLETRAA
jgi:hypothetical protein